ncbi:hypothetical protein QFZ54_003709 [Sphingomonas faeni]|nr:hypothetical protein [Sphingomonas faeni]
MRKPIGPRVVATRRLPWPCIHAPQPTAASGDGPGDNRPPIAPARASVDRAPPPDARRSSPAVRHNEARSCPSATVTEITSHQGAPRTGGDRICRGADEARPGPDILTRRRGSSTVENAEFLLAQAFVDANRFITIGTAITPNKPGSAPGPPRVRRVARRAAGRNRSGRTMHQALALAPPRFAIGRYPRRSMSVQCGPPHVYGLYPAQRCGVFAVTHDPERAQQVHCVQDRRLKQRFRSSRSFVRLPTSIMCSSD